MRRKWEAIGKDLGFETSETAKKAFTSLRTKYVRRKKTLKNSERCGANAEKVMKAEKTCGRDIYSFVWAIL